MPNRFRLLGLALRLGMCLIMLGGCGKPAPINKQTFRHDDPLSGADVKLFLTIAQQLPEGTLLEAKTPYRMPPKWDSERTLPVKELVNIELHELNAGWTHSSLAVCLPDSKEFARILKRHHLSKERFASLAFAVGVALSKSAVSKELDVNSHLKKAQRVVNELRQDQRPYHTLSPDVLHEVHRKLVWLSEYQRGERLASVPAQNLKVIQKSRDKLAKLLPAAFSTSPFNGQLDRNLDMAMPFDDLPGNEGLELLEWDPTAAIIGRGA